MTHHAQQQKDAETVRDALEEFRSYTKGTWAEDKWDHEGMMVAALAALKRLEVSR